MAIVPKKRFFFNAEFSSIGGFSVSLELTRPCYFA